MTVAELSDRMSVREFEEQMIYDRLHREAQQEAALDRLQAQNHAAAIKRRRG